MNHLPFIPPSPSVSTHLARLAVAIVAVALTGCEPRATEHRVIGTIYFDEPRVPDWPLPQVPDTATAGVPLEITIWTEDTNCAMRKGDTEVTELGRSAVVVPYDIRTTYEWGFDPLGLLPVNDPGCYLIDLELEHKATVVFEEPGTATLWLVYSKLGGPRPEDKNKGDGLKVYTVEVLPAGG